MIADQELQALVDFRGEKPVLSLYLNTNLAHQSKDAVKLMARQQLREYGKQAQQEIQAIDRYLDFEYDWQAPGLAVFASGRELWQTIALPLPVTPQAYYTERPYVRVLSDVKDRLSPYVVALLDSESLRLFEVTAGAIRTGSETSGDEIKRHRQGGRSAARLQRHEDNLALHNLKQAAQMIQDFAQTTGCSRLILAGNPEAIAQIKDYLPKHMLGQMIGEFAADMEATPKEILVRSLELVAQADLAEEQRIVSEAITAAAKGRAGVIGLADTLYALHRAQVRMLLIEENYHAPGYVCTNCGFVSAEMAEKCPFCSENAISETPDVANRAIEKALQTGAEVNIVRQNEELSRAGGIAATLRY
jgi:peptide chain release factor subunit 1